MRARAAALLSLSAVLLSHPSAFAQGTARSMDIDTSIRASGMAEAATAVFFGDDLTWANPALFGYVSGLRYQRGRTQLVPGLASDVFFRSEQVRAGAGGVGVVLSGRPSLDGMQLDYGSDPAFDGFERVKSWGFGISALRMVESLVRASGGTPTPRSVRFDAA